MTTARWDTWIEINPVTADRLDVTDNDLVSVRSPYGELEAIVVVYPAIRPDVVAIPTGQGHEDFGRYAARGANVMKLIAPAPEPVSGNMTWGGIRVHVEKIEGEKELARLESLDGEGRDVLD
jgi:molybdopterin-containing oxidoreductase family iron-sulfur binding subunit